MAAIPEGAAPNFPSILSWIIQAARLLRAVVSGETENTFKGTLRANQTTSTFTDPRIKFGSAVIPVPQTANASAIAPPYPSSIENGSVTFTHASNANADKTFLFVIVGGPTPPTRTAS
jgi:hypothetical protein